MWGRFRDEFLRFSIHSKVSVAFTMCVFSLFDTSPTWATGSSVVMKLPCGSSTSVSPASPSPKPPCSLGFLKCSNGSSSAQLDCNSPTNGVVQQVECAVNQLMQNKFKYFYSSGIDVDLLKTTDPQHPVGSTVQLPLCNLDEGEVTQVNSTLHPNAQQTGCGTFQQYIMTGINTRDGYGTRETAYMNGLYVQALKCFKQQIFNELENNSSVTVQNMTAAASDLQSNYQTLTQDITNGSMSAICSLPASCGSYQNQCSIPVPGASLGPNASPIPIPISSTSSDTSCYQVVVCKLFSAEQKFIAASEYIVMQEIESRARASWTSLIQSLPGMVYAQVETPCLNNVATPACPTLLGVSDLSCIADQMNKCYAGTNGQSGKYVPYMQSLIQQYYPDSGSCHP